jgi:hypothetical protein
MPEQHTVVITVEASGVVTPAPQPDPVEATEEGELTDG